MKPKSLIHRVIFLGRKKGAAAALQYLLSCSISVTIVVTDPKDAENEQLVNVATNNNIYILSDPDKIYTLIKQNDLRIRNIDLVISYLFWKRIKQPLISLPKRGCINFHPAPITEYKGRAGYNTALLDRRKTYGATSHFIDSEAFDQGPIIKIRRFVIRPDVENALSLERRTQREMSTLFVDVINLFNTKSIIRTKLNTSGIYLNKKQIEGLKIIHPKKDSSEYIDRKIRAFFYPPYTGATIMIKNKAYTLINQDILNYIQSIMTYEKI